MKIDQEQMELELVQEMVDGMGDLLRVSLLNQGTGVTFFVHKWIERELRGQRILRSNKRLVAMKRIQENGGCLELSEWDINFQIYLKIGSIIRQCLSLNGIKRMVNGNNN